MILDLLSVLDRRVLGSLIATGSVLGAAVVWAQRETGAALGSTGLFLPAAALGVVAVVVQPFRSIALALVLGSALMVAGLVVGFGL